MSARITDAISVFPLRPTYRGKCAFSLYDLPQFLKRFCRSDTHIVVSTPRETHLFRVDEYEERIWYMDPTTISGLVTGQPTLALANVMKRAPGKSGASAYGDSSFVVQVTPVGVSVLEMDPELGTTSPTGSIILEETADWKGKRVVAASINASQVFVALEGGVMASFGPDEHGHLKLRQWAICLFPTIPSLTIICHQGRKPSMMRYLVYHVCRWTPPNRTHLKSLSVFGDPIVYKSSVSSTLPTPSNSSVPANLTPLCPDPYCYITLERATTGISRSIGPTSWLGWPMARWFLRRILRRSINSGPLAFPQSEVQLFI